MWGSRSLARFAYEVRTWRTFATHTDMAFFSLIYSIESLKSNYAFQRFFAYTHFKEEDAVTHLLLKTTTPQISNTQSRITHSRMRSSCKPGLSWRSDSPHQPTFNGSSQSLLCCVWQIKRSPYPCEFVCWWHGLVIRPRDWDCIACSFRSHFRAADLQPGV